MIQIPLLSDGTVVRMIVRWNQQINVNLYQNDGTSFLGYITYDTV